MGQRLNIEIKKNDEIIANCYYHWSAYTTSALDLVETIVDCFNELDKNQHEELIAYKLLKSTNAELSNEKEATSNIEEYYKANKSTVNRNLGLISFSEDGIENTRWWEEYRVEIDIENETIFFNVFFKNHKIELHSKVKTLDWDITKIKIKDFINFKNEIYNSTDIFKFNNSSFYYECIE